MKTNIEAFPMWAIVEKSGNNALLSQRIVLQPFTWPTVGTYGLRGGDLNTI